MLNSDSSKAFHKTESFEEFLFPTSKPPANQTLEEQQFDESLDVKVVQLIRDQIMPFAAKIPKEFLLQTV